MPKNPFKADLPKRELKPDRLPEPKLNPDFRAAARQDGKGGSPVMALQLLGSQQTLFLGAQDNVLAHFFILQGSCSVAYYMPEASN